MTVKPLTIGFCTPKGAESLTEPKYGVTEMLKKLLGNAVGKEIPVAPYPTVAEPHCMINPLGKI